MELGREERHLQVVYYRVGNETGETVMGRKENVITYLRSQAECL